MIPCRYFEFIALSPFSQLRICVHEFASNMYFLLMFFNIIPILKNY